MNIYDHNDIEKKWQEKWAADGIYQTLNQEEGKENFYMLTEFSYPSGNLHVGHWYAFAVSDMFARYQRMQGKNVLFPMGFDSFGLPAENAAIKRGLDPKKWTYENMDYMKQQLRSMGAMFDWERTLATSNPDYYKWTQWMFAEFFKNDLAYRATTQVNWCPSCQTILANEQVVDGHCERCDSEVVQRDQEQWMLRITEFADQLHDDLDELDWPEEIKAAQRSWIGRSEGAELSFELKVKSEKPEDVKDYVIFDFDGVIGDTWEGTLKAKMEIDNCSRAEAIKSHIGYASRRPHHVRGATNGVLDNSERWYKSFRKASEKHKNEFKLFSKMVEFITQHPNLQYAIVSSGCQNYITYLLEQTNLKPTHVLAYEDHHSKEEKVERVCCDWGVGIEKIWYVTDTKADVYELSEIMSKKRIIGCSWGYLDRNSLLEVLPPAQVADDPVDIHNILSSEINVFTTRPDTLFGVTYVVLAPEHELVSELLNQVENKKEVEDYITATKKKSDLDRQQSKEKTGVELKGVTAINPANNEEIPVWIADYVLAGYGTGAVMAVPAHDERDFEFAKKFDLAIRQVIAPEFEKKEEKMHKMNASYGLIQRADGKILLQHATFSSFAKGKVFYRLPGGGADEGESFEQALYREIEEETGYKFSSFEKEIASVMRYHQESYKPGGVNDLARSKKLFLLDYETATEGNLKPEDYEVSYEYKWYEPQEAIKLMEKDSDEVFADELWMLRQAFNREAFAGVGILINSGKFDGLTSEEAKEKITAHVGGQMKKTYRLRDWGISRQRYWGCPIPVVYDPEGRPHAIPEEHLPWHLPEDVDHTPDGTAPLARSAELKKRTEEIFGKGWTPEVETMDAFLDSSWYFYRYLDNNNDAAFCSKDAQKQWMPIDLYMGGAEHTTMHLLYSRFWNKALHKLGHVAESEPYKVRRNRGLILGPDGNKMSKSKGNVIDPDEQVKQLGSDTVRMYLAFMGPYGTTANYPWNQDGVVGIRRFIERVWRLGQNLAETDELQNILHKTIKGVTEDMQKYKFNTAISKMMIFSNTAEKEPLSKTSYGILLQLLAPLAPHIVEELWHEVLGNTESIHLAPWPKHDESLIIDDVITLPIQINGKVRAKIEVHPEISQDDLESLVHENEMVQKWLEGKEVKKFIYVPGKIVNIVMS
jgi:leucyl-tRNA synthetase